MRSLTPRRRRRRCERLGAAGCLLGAVLISGGVTALDGSTKTWALIHQTLASADTSSSEATLRKIQRRWLPAWCCRLWCCHHTGWIHQNLVLIHQTLASADTLSPDATLRRARRRWLPAWCCNLWSLWCHGDRPGWINKNLVLIRQTLASADTLSPEATLRKARRRWLPARRGWRWWRRGAAGCLAPPPALRRWLFCCLLGVDPPNPGRRSTKPWC